VPRTRIEGWLPSGWTIALWPFPQCWQSWANKNFWLGIDELTGHSDISSSRESQNSSSSFVWSGERERSCHISQPKISFIRLNFRCSTCSYSCKSRTNSWHRSFKRFTGHSAILWFYPMICN
jgi:hypothetical protein